MFKAFYGLTAEPFSKSLEPSELYFSKEFKESLLRLDYMKNAKGLMLFTGQSGTRKSTCLRAFIDSLNTVHYKPIYIPLSSVSIIEFYRQLNYSLGGEFIQRKSDLFLSIQKLILEYNKNSNTIPIIIFDDVQYIKGEIFFELQMLLILKQVQDDITLMPILLTLHW